jgi:hypothetical protein
MEMRETVDTRDDLCDLGNEEKSFCPSDGKDLCVFQGSINFIREVPVFHVTVGFLVLQVLSARSIAYDEARKK